MKVRILASSTIIFVHLNTEVYHLKVFNYTLYNHLQFRRSTNLPLPEYVLSWRNTFKHWGRDTMGAILQTTLQINISWKEVMNYD